MPAESPSRPANSAGPQGLRGPALAWQKPWLPRDQDRRVAYGDDTVHCEPVPRQRVGPPVYEDAMLVVFRAPRG